MRRRILILGYGSIGQYLADALLNRADLKAGFELVGVWNRSADRFAGTALPQAMRLHGDDPLEAVRACPADLVVEVAHPGISARAGPAVLAQADFLVGSPSTFADPTIEQSLRAAASIHGCYIPSGAGWGVQDIARMDKARQLAGLSVDMAFPADSLKLAAPLAGKLEAYRAGEDSADLVLYDGPVRPLCALAPNNVNTMACMAIAAPSLGFDGVKARLLAHKGPHAHITAIRAQGTTGLTVETRRYNPSRPGAVTGSATLGALLAGAMEAGGRGGGIHFC